MSAFLTDHKFSKFEVNNNGALHFSLAKIRNFIDESKSIFHDHT